MKRAWCLACAALAVVACSSESDGSSSTTTTTSSSDPPARQLDVNVHESAGGVTANNVTCNFDGDRLIAAGVVRNTGEAESYVSIEVRFVDAAGVRIELATDSVSSLQPGESARWDVTSYPTGAAEATACEVSLNPS